MRPSFVKSLNVDDTRMTIKDWIEEIVCYNDVSIFLCKVGRFILRVIRWIPVLWKQEEWDFGYTYNLIDFKLREIRKVIEKDTWHVKEEVEEELKQIDSVLLHLDKFRNWTNYIEIPETPKDWDEFPIDEKTGMSMWNATPEQHEAYQKAHEFEMEHYNAFWDELKQHNGNWWT